MQLLAPDLAAECSPLLLQQLPGLLGLAEANREGLVIATPAGRCVMINTMAGVLCALAEPAPLTVLDYLLRLRERCRPVDDPWPSFASQEDVLALLASRRRLRLVWVDERANGSGQRQHYVLTPYRLTGDDGQVIGFAVFLRDETALVKEESLESSLLSSISHDLRTPLATMKAAVTALLQEGLIWDEQVRREMLQDINEETDRLTMLVKSLLEISRIEGGALRLQTEWCDLAEIVHTVLDRLEQLTKGHRLSCDLRQPLPLVQGDFMQLERVLTNLVENAVKYAPVGSEIGVIVEMREREVWVSVLDEGPGIPLAERERIFQKFYRIKQRRPMHSPERATGADRARTGGRCTLPPLAGGAGLGLAICRGIVAQHAGRIWVEPRTAGGSCFVFTLPVEATAPMSGRGISESGGLREAAEREGATALKQKSVSTRLPQEGLGEEKEQA